MTCNCVKELRASAYDAAATAFTITAVPACACNGAITQLFNGQRFRLITCLAFPAVTTLVPVYIEINGTSYPVLDENGNTLMSDQVRSRRCYNLLFGTNPVHFILKQCSCPSQATPSVVAITTTTGGAAA